MRQATLVTLMMILASATAFAKGKDDEAGKKSGSSMDSGDPAATETSDKPKIDENGEKGEKGKGASADAEVASDEPVIAARGRDPLALFADIRIGFGQGPVPGLSLNTTGPGYTGKGTVFTFMVGGRYDITPEISLGLRAPWTVGSERLQYVSGGGTTVRGSAFGSPELMLEYRAALSPRLHVPLLFGVGIPLAQGTAAAYVDNANVGNEAGHSLQRRLQYLADAAAGWKDEELFDPKRVPVVLGAGIDYERKALQAHAGIKLIVPIATTSALNVADTRVLDSSGSYSGKNIAFREVTSAGISYDVPVSPKVTLTPSAETWLVWKAINTIEYKSTAVSPSRVQLVFEPRVMVTFSKKPRISPSLGYMFPIGGQLSTAKMGSLDLRADFYF